MWRVPYRFVRRRTGSVTDARRFQSHSAAGNCAASAATIKAPLGCVVADDYVRRPRADDHPVATGPSHEYPVVLDLRSRLSASPVGAFALLVARLRLRST